MLTTKLVVAGAVLSFVGAACGGNDDGGTSTAGTGTGGSTAATSEPATNAPEMSAEEATSASTEETTGSSAAAGAPEPGMKLCVAKATTNNPFDTVTLDGHREEGEALGYEVLFSDAEEDPNTQIQQIADFVAAGCDGIAVHAATPAVGDGIRELAADIPIVSSDRNVTPPYGGALGENPQLHVGWDGYGLGNVMGQLIVDACAEKDPCLVVEEQGVLGSAPQIERSEGVDWAAEQNPAIEIIDRQVNDFDVQKAATVTEALVAAHGTFDVLVTQSDDTAVAALQVLEDAGREGVAVIGAGGSEAGLQAIEEGRMYGTAWVSPFDYAKLAMVVLDQLINGVEPDVRDVNGVPTVVVEVVKITQENASDYPGY